MYSTSVQCITGFVTGGQHRHQLAAGRGLQRARDPRVRRHQQPPGPPHLPRPHLQATHARQDQGRDPRPRQELHQSQAAGQHDGEDITESS